MAKKLSKSRRKVHRRPAKKSWLDSLFTFPKVVVYAFVILSAVTFYQISLPGADVKGVSVPDDEMSLITEEEAKTLAESKASNPYTVHQIQVFVDNKKTDGKFDVYKEECLGNYVTIYVDNGNKVKEFPGIWGCENPIRVKTKTRELTVGLRSVSGYKFTGLTYRDQNHPNDTTRMGISKIKVKGFYTYGQYYTVIDFGVKKK